MILQEARAYLDSLTNFEHQHAPQAMRAVRLDRMRTLCERLGDPQDRFRSILVSGTNGKGSVCAVLYEILRQAGLPVGLYTSPHVVEIRERIRVARGTPPAAGDPEGSDWIGPEALAAAIERVRAVVEDTAEAWPDGPPTYFETLTAAAFLHFRDQRVAVAVLEVGLGGRLDATNVVEQALSVIAPIGLDHTDVLGGNLAAITHEKAGILKPNQVLVSARQQPEVAALLRGAAAAHGCRILESGRHFGAEVLGHDPGGLRVTIRGPRGVYEQMEMALLGRHQADNAAVAVAAVESLSEVGVPYAAVRAGLTHTRWPGRLEVIPGQPTVVLDGAHNPPAAQALRAALQELWPGRRLHLLLGLSLDKPAQAIGEILGPLAASVTCTASRHPRACEPRALAHQVGPFNPEVHIIPDAVDAYTYLLNTVAPEDLLVITGSLFLVGQLRAIVRQTRAPRSPSPLSGTCSALSEGEGRMKGIEPCRS